MNPNLPWQIQGILTDNYVRIPTLPEIYSSCQNPFIFLQFLNLSEYIAVVRVPCMVRLTPVSILCCWGRGDSMGSNLTAGVLQVFPSLFGLVSSVRRVLASKLRCPGFKSRPGTVGGPVTIIMWGALPG